ncbi:peptidylprolyl isomerase [Sutcliffiella sp. NC1]|uniref:peptidylprolyl isomerase n=1 Tax=Sutcliffiella sp. NC1 TaxID=3004096 RepID=UPI0022DCE4BF|nr:peptidyl-prolyl cis-trans isomerase [Sutcliffiella sp. NC1]WBL15205.1 peptidyl-prolyl cis-trans isomerase [Sutcliffiella sp. NC1]
MLHYIKRLSKQTLWYCVIGLIVINIITIVITTNKANSKSQEVVSLVQSVDDVVAEVDETPITKLELLTELEKRFGSEVLQELVNRKVVNVMANKYNITISDEEVDREWKLIKTIYQHNTNFSSNSVEEMKEHIRTSLQLEELLVKDVTIPEDEVQKFYEQNKVLYNIPESYHLSQIIVNDKKTAEQVMKELKEGSSFSALAMEKSIDDLSANQGGDIGYLSSQHIGNYPEIYIKEASELQSGKWSTPIQLEDEAYAIIYLHEKIDATNFSYEDVKDQVRRMLALEQIEEPVRVEMFWNEVGVEWLYDNEETN